MNLLKLKTKFLFLLPIAIALAGCPNVDQNNFITTPAEDDKYTVYVRNLAGQPVANAVVTLDYNGGMSDYAPPKFRTDSTGRVSIPHAYAERQGWEFLTATGMVGKRELRSELLYHGKVNWPQTVTLSLSHYD